MSDEPEAASESVEELVDDGQYFEAEVVDGVENAPLADEAELTIHERPRRRTRTFPTKKSRERNVSSADVACSLAAFGMLASDCSRRA